MFNAETFEMKRTGYLSIREAAVRYEVSRAKLHRLVQLGRLQATKDPRDERVTLLKTEDLESLFQFPLYKVEDMEYRAGTQKATESAGRLTAELRDRINGVRGRIAAGGGIAQDSVEIIRQEREKRGQQIDTAAFGNEGEYDTLRGEGDSRS